MPNLMRFMIERILNGVSTATLVKVNSVTVAGQVGPVGQLDATPLVNLTDGKGNTSKHGVVHNLAYFRLQGGNKAVILDPKADDIGVAVFADRDISNVKKNKKQSPPASYRRFDMADGLFFPCFLGGKPSCYVRFTDDNHIIVSPDDQNTFLTLTDTKMTMQVGNSKIEIDNGNIKLTSANIDHLQP